MSAHRLFLKINSLNERLYCCLCFVKRLPLHLVATIAFALRTEVDRSRCITNDPLKVLFQQLGLDVRDFEILFPFEGDEIFSCMANHIVRSFACINTHSFLIDVKGQIVRRTGYKSHVNIFPSFWKIYNCRTLFKLYIYISPTFHYFI